ncbi:TPA: glycoside hydrolase family 2 protein [Streptococcus suis]
MIRTFETHRIREYRELSDSLWNFHTLEGDRKEKTIQVAVPSCWETYPDTLTYRGKASYSRPFQAEGNVRLEFKGVSYTAKVLVDGKEVASHYNAYTIFDVVLKNMPAGTHTLEVIADNTFSEDSALHIPNDYQSYGGISRPVVLEQLGDVYVKWVHFTPLAEGKDWYGKADVSIANLSDKTFRGVLELTLNDKVVKELPVELQSGETKVFHTEKLAFPDVKNWSPEQPVLYYLAATLQSGEQKLDDLIERVGFREVRTVGKDILLNGKKLFIKGFFRHEDHPQFGCALPFSALQYDLMVAKDLGANSIRTVHYPNDELFLDLCDEQGILIWEENHARGLSEENMKNPHFKKQCEDCIQEMIMAHYSHPAIYIGSITNFVG